MRCYYRMVIAIEFILFIYFLCITGIIFFVPGFVVLSLVDKKINGIEKNILSLLIGASFFLLLSYILAWLQIPYAYYIFPCICLLILFKKKYSLSLGNIPISILLIIVVGTISYGIQTFFSGMNIHGQITFIGFNAVDGITHIAYITNQALCF